MVADSTAQSPPFAENQPADSRPAPKLFPENYDRFHRSEYRLETQPKEISLSQIDYERFRAFLLETIGLDYPEDKRYMLGWGLSRVLQATASQNLDQLYALLQTHSLTSPVWDQLISALTVGETYFFRNSNHFDALAKHILVDLMALRGHSTRRIRIWSAGCASGEEPYSVAMLLHELIPDLENWDISILATDINREALRKAQEGVYAGWSFRGVEKRVQETYFVQQGDDRFAISDKIKQMVTFAYLNLVGDHYPSLTNNTNAIDVILCRNVTIYFSASVTQRVVRGLRDCLVEGGWLIPGSSEPNRVFYADFEPRNFPGTVVYQKPAESIANFKSLGAKPLTPPRPAALPSTGRPIPTPKAAVVKPPSGLPDLYQQALESMQAGQVDAAMAKLYAKLKEDEGFAPTYFTLGKIFANKGNLEQARYWCEQAIRRDKLHPEPYYTLGLIQLEHNRLDLALDALKKAVFLDREFVMAHYSLAQAYSRQGNQELARKSSQNVQRLLDGKPGDALVPEGDGLNIARLRELVAIGLGDEEKTA